MLVPLGQMREPVIILTPVRSTDESGGETLIYTESDPVFVALRSLTTTEGVQFGQVNAAVTHVLFGNWNDLAQLASNQRIRVVETNQEFDIAGAPINSPKRDWTKLTLVWRENG